MENETTECRWCEECHPRDVAHCVSCGAPAEVDTQRQCQGCAALGLPPVTSGQLVIAWRPGGPRFVGRVVDYRAGGSVVIEYKRAENIAALSSLDYATRQLNVARENFTGCFCCWELVPA